MKSRALKAHGAAVGDLEDEFPSLDAFFFGRDVGALEFERGQIEVGARVGFEGGNLQRAGAGLGAVASGASAPRTRPAARSACRQQAHTAFELQGVFEGGFGKLGGAKVLDAHFDRDLFGGDLDAFVDPESFGLAADDRFREGDPQAVAIFGVGAGGEQERNGEHQESGERLHKAVNPGDRAQLRDLLPGWE